MSDRGVSVLLNWKRSAWGMAALAALVVLGALGWGLLHPAGTAASPVVGNPAPNIVVQSYGGSRVSLDSMQGEPVVLNFWASWCAPCRQEAPALDSAAHRLAGRVHFLGVDIQDSASSGARMAASYGYPYPMGPARGGVPPAYAVTAPPITFFINAHGIVVGRFLGPVDATSLNQYLQLAGGSS
jgi:cytochrome c biogenesis protein CcmG/thiol:disulfide interchange protein DsbE